MNALRNSETTFNGKIWTAQSALPCHSVSDVDHHIGKKNSWRRKKNPLKILISKVHSKIIYLLVFPSKMSKNSSSGDRFIAGREMKTSRKWRKKINKFKWTTSTRLIPLLFVCLWFTAIGQLIRLDIAVLHTNQFLSSLLLSSSL